MSNANEPAFPTSVQRGQGGEYWTEDEGGLTKREYFAAIAMQAGLSQAQAGSIEALPQVFAILAKFSVMAADALLAELAKK